MGIIIEEEKQVRTYDNSFYARLAKLTLQDLRSNKRESVFFSTYTKDKVVDYLKNPEKNQKQLREICQYLYTTSSHFRRLIQYLALMPLFSYIVVPYGANSTKVNEKMFKANYYKTVDYLQTMNIPLEFQRILLVCFKEDVFHGYCYRTDQSFYIRQLPSSHCAISSVEDSCFNTSFDFSYFDNSKHEPKEFGDEFVQRYNAYSGGNSKTRNNDLRWQELDSKNSICIKVNSEIIYASPPFIGILEELYDIEDYKALTKQNVRIQNTALLSFELEIDKETNLPVLDDAMRQKFYAEIADQVPDDLGYLITPFKASSFNWKDNNSNLSNNVSNAESELYSAAGISQMLFNNAKASSAIIKDSINADFDIVKPLLRQIQQWINRSLKQLDSKYRFEVKILDVNSYNQESMFKLYKESATLGLPTKMAMGAVLGFTPSETLNMGMLEETLNLRDDLFSKPLLSSNTQSADSGDEGGKPKSEEPLEETGEQTENDDENANR